MPARKRVSSNAARSVAVDAPTAPRRLCGRPRLRAPAAPAGDGRKHPRFQRFRNAERCVAPCERRPRTSVRPPCPSRRLEPRARSARGAPVRHARFGPPAVGLVASVATPRLAQRLFEHCPNRLDVPRNRARTSGCSARRDRSAIVKKLSVAGRRLPADGPHDPRSPSLPVTRPAILKRAASHSATLSPRGPALPLVDGGGAAAGSVDHVGVAGRHPGSAQREGAPRKPIVEWSGRRDSNPRP